MGFEIGKKVQSGDITLDQLTQKLQDVKLQQKAATIFKQFNTNRTANEAGQQVLDTTEQVALMSFFKEIAGGKKSDSKDTNLGRGDLRHFKKNHNGDNNAFSFIQDLGYGDMKKIMSAFTGVVEADDSDNQTIGSWEQKDGQVNKVTIGDKDYTINPDNTVSDADGVTYKYENGKLTEKKDGNTTTTFNEGVRAGETTTTPIIIVGDKTYDVVDGKVTIGNQTCEVENGKVKINEKEYVVQTQESKTTYKKDGNTIDQTVVSDPNTVTTTKYRDDGSTMDFKKVEDKKTKTTTTTYYQPDGKNKLREVTVDPSKTTTTNYTSQSGLVNRTIQEGEKTTTINYGQRTQTITQGDVETVETFKNFDPKNGSVASDNFNISKRVVTNKKDHTRTTTEPSANQASTIELLDDNNSTVQRKVTFENGEAKITVGGKTITLFTDSYGNILGNRKCKGLRMETVEEAVVRLGYKKGSEEYKAIIAANKGNKGAIKIPAKVVANLRGLNTDTAVVDAAAERRQLNRNIVAHREQNRASYGQQAFNTYNKKHPKAKLRGTWASTSKQVYCTEDANIGGKGYNQHYIYDAASNGLVKLESYLNLRKGQYVDRITEDGHARIQPGNKLVKIDIKKRTTTASSAAEYNSSFESSVRKGAKGDISGTVNSEKHKYVYYGSNQRVDVTNDATEYKQADGSWTQAQINDDNDVSVATNTPATNSRQNMPTSTVTGNSPSATGNQTWHDVAPRDNTYVRPAMNPTIEKIPVKAPGPRPATVTISWVKYSSGGNSNTPTATVNGVQYTGSAGGVSFGPETRRNANIKDLKDQITKIYGDGIKFVMSNEV